LLAVVVAMGGIKVGGGLLVKTINHSAVIATICWLMWSNNYNSTELRTNPITPNGYPQLRLGKEIQIRQLQATLRDSATSPTYFEYLQTKFEWVSPPATTIHWPTIQLALTRFKTSEK